MGYLRCALMCLLAVAILPLHATQGKKYPKLTVALLKKTPDKNLEDLIYETVLARTRAEDYGYKAVMKLPEGVRVVYCTMRLEAEVNNGGFHQYFWNSDGVFAQEALKGLRTIGAKHDAVLLQKAINIQKLEKARMAKFKAKGHTSENFIDSAKGSKLNDLDQEFYDNGDDLSKLRIRYIRAHPEKFVEK